MSVREAKERIYADEFVRWVVYDQVEGLTPVSAQQFAHLCTLLCNYLSPKQGRSFVLEDFLPQWDRRPKPPQSPAEIEQKLLFAFGMKD